MTLGQLADKATWPDKDRLHREYYLEPLGPGLQPMGDYGFPIGMNKEAARKQVEDALKANCLMMLSEERV